MVKDFLNLEILKDHRQSNRKHKRENEPRTRKREEGKGKVKTSIQGKAKRTTDEQKISFQNMPSVKTKIKDMFPEKQKKMFPLNILLLYMYISALRLVLLHFKRLFIF